MSQICERPGHAQEVLAPSPTRYRTILLRLLIVVLETPVVWMERWEHRQKLRELDDRILHDVGLSRADIYQEARKPFWRP
ncbi:DUF1127 domain-containing protein [Fodinicurvata halophila]|uniref:DUF1127 domain-containing protein n=1 Tax=Fodinicurvata halophila TaxID=1419723 RepID=A0ABV8UM13_9PROT